VAHRNKEVWKYMHSVRIWAPGFDLYMTRGIFMAELRSVLSQKDASQNGVLEPFSSPSTDIGITNATSLRPNFWSFFAFQNLSQKKNSTASDSSVGSVTSVLFAARVLASWGFTA
jgi:hypothetical protein